MGIYDDTRTPAGFCFVVFEDPASAALCVLYQVCSISLQALVPVETLPNREVYLWCSARGGGWGSAITTEWRTT